MKFGPKEIKELNQYLKIGRNRTREFMVDLVDDLEPGSLKDELLKDFDPSQETYEEYLQRKSLERPFNMADGGRIGFNAGGAAEVRKYLKGLKKGSTVNIKNYLDKNNITTKNKRSAAASNFLFHLYKLL